MYPHRVSRWIVGVYVAGLIVGFFTLFPGAVALILAFTIGDIRPYKRNSQSH